MNSCSCADLGKILRTYGGRRVGVETHQKCGNIIRRRRRSDGRGGGDARALRDALGEILRRFARTRVGVEAGREAMDPLGGHRPALRPLDGGDGRHLVPDVVQNHDNGREGLVWAAKRRRRCVRLARRGVREGSTGGTDDGARARMCLPTSPGTFEKSLLNVWRSSSSRQVSHLCDKVHRGRGNAGWSAFPETALSGSRATMRALVLATFLALAAASSDVGGDACSASPPSPGDRRRSRRALTFASHDADWFLAEANDRPSGSPHARDHEDASARPRAHRRGRRLARRRYRARLRPGRVRLPPASSPRPAPPRTPPSPPIGARTSSRRVRFPSPRDRSKTTRAPRERRRRRRDRF